MKFEKVKLNRCQTCKYYKRIGNLHWCINSDLYREHGLEALAPIPLICFRKKVKDEIGRK